MTTPSLMLAWRLEGRRVLIVGGGHVAEGRVALALDAGAEIRLVAPEISESLRETASAGRLEWLARAVVPEDLNGMDMVLVAVDDPAASGATGDWARDREIPVNVADEPDRCDFWFASTFRDGPVQVAVSTNGASPGGGARLKRLFRSVLPKQAAPAIARLGHWRAEQRKREASMGRRMSRAAKQARLPWAQAPQPGGPPARGQVTLVGAGPGDPGLLTAAALDALAAAELVVADRLVPPEIMALVDCETRIARKWPGRSGAAQQELNQWVLEGINAGKQVVRLKQGDPFVFGRGGEEITWFGARGVAVTVVQGVSSAFAAPAAVGIPVTHRGASDHVTVLTARGAGDTDVPLPDFSARGTLIWLMGVGSLSRLAEGLMTQRGFPADWPVAIIERAHQPGQRAIRASLNDIAGLVASRGIAAPATIVMGKVVLEAPSTKFELDTHTHKEVHVA